MRAAQLETTLTPPAEDAAPASNARPQAEREAVVRSSLPTRASVWVAIAVPGDQMASALPVRLTRAGFAPTPGYPWLFMTELVASTRALELILSAIVRGEAKRGLRMAVLRSDIEPNASDVLAELEDADRGLARLRAQWLVPMLADHRLDAAFAPAFDGHGDVGYEIAVGYADGPQGSIAAERLLGAARDLDLLAFVDRLLRQSAVAAFGAAASDARALIPFAVDAWSGSRAFATSVATLVASHDLEPARVVLAAVGAETANPTVLHETLDELRKAGFGIALEGLGLLRHGVDLLRTIEPDLVGIDGRIVRAAPDGGAPTDRLQALVTTATELGIATIARGIESADQLGVARRAGIDFFEGRLLSEPRLLPLRRR